MMNEPFRIVTQPESWAREVKDDVVSAIRSLLDRAQAGEIQGIAYSCATIDNMVITGCTKNVNQSAIIGGLERIKHRILAGED